MTGYLHIPTDELAAKLTQWFEITLSYHTYKTWDDAQFAGEMAEFLRGLSVEPTGQRRVACPSCGKSTAVSPNGAVFSHRSPTSAIRCPGSRQPAPVPVQEDQP